MSSLDDSGDERLAGRDETGGDDADTAVGDAPAAVSGTGGETGGPAAVEDGQHSAQRRPPRPADLVRFELDLALGYQQRYRSRPTADRWVQMMRDANEADIVRLQAELAAATASGVDGRPVVPNRGDVERPAAWDQTESPGWPRSAKGLDDFGL